MKKNNPWRILPAALVLTLALTGCNMGGVGSIGADGAVQINGKDVTVSEPGDAPVTNPLAEETSAQAQPEAQAAEEAADQPEAQPEVPDLSGAVVLEETRPEEEPPEDGQVWGQEPEPEDNPLTQIDLPEPQEPEMPAPGELYAVFEEDLNDLELALQDLPDRDAAGEIRDYFAAAEQTALDAGCTVEAQVMYRKEPVLSVLRTVTDREGRKTLRSETFQTETAGLFTLADFFPGLEEADWLDPLLAVADETLGCSDQELYSASVIGVDSEDGSLREVLERTFDPDCFYLTSQGLCIYFQAGVLSDGSVQVILPYSRLSGFVMPE